MKRRTHSERAFGRARRGAYGLVYVETVVALPVVFFFAMVTLQLCDYLDGAILVKHAAIAAARAAAVIGPEDPKYYGGQAVDDLGGGARLNDVREAVRLALMSKKQFRTEGFDLKVAAPNTPYDMVTVKLSIDYHCSIPFLSAVCGFASTRTINGTGMFPYQSRN